MARYNYVDFDGKKNLTILHEGELVTVSGEHAKFNEIYLRVQDESDTLSDLTSILDPAEAISDRFEKIGEQVAVKNGHVLFEGREVHDVITDHIVRFYEEGNDDFKPLVKFLEKLQANPNEHSKEHLYRWLKAQQLAIAENGDFIAYKGVRSDLTSVHKGDGIVNGVQFTNSYLPNEDGNEVEMPRDEVTFDPADGCSFGLHAGSWRYANGFGHRVLEVHINPRDVVSVPVDCADQKLRTCRYRVVKELQREYTSAFVPGTYSWDEPDDDEDDVANDLPEFVEGEEYVINTDDYNTSSLFRGTVVRIMDDEIDSDDEVLVAFDDEDGDERNVYVVYTDLTDKHVPAAAEPEVPNYAAQFTDYATPVEESDTPLYDQTRHRGGFIF
jgi:hypothetical protein